MPATADGFGTEPIRPLSPGHAHNDFQHEHPLLDALSHGFTSVEADVWLIDGELRVGHDAEDAASGGTLETLYLQPLARRVQQNDGSVHRDRSGFQLLIDLKSAGSPTYAAVEEALAGYPDVFATAVTKGDGVTLRPGAVLAVISGDRPLAQMQAQRVRRGFYDGRVSDLDRGFPVSFMPLVSDSWTRHFTWMGVGPFPAVERAKLEQIVTDAHHGGARLRFHTTPDAGGSARDALWTELLRAGVDHLNTSDLSGLESFLRRG